MSSIRIKNFGPIKEGYQENDGWIDLKKVTFFIGNQGSGKSTVAKLISTLIWAEKAMVKGTMKPDWLNTYNRFNKQCSYHNIGNYFKQNTVIEYKGDARAFSFADGHFTSTIVPSDKYLLPKIMYTPAERNFLTAIEQAEKVKYLPSALVTFQDEYLRAFKKIKDRIMLPINKTSFFVSNGVPFIATEDYVVKLSEASSGFQAVVPLFLVYRDLANLIHEGADIATRELSSDQMKRLRNEIAHILLNDNLAQEVKDESLRVLSSKIKIDCLINIVEEPEQNLFPHSQKEVLESLLEFNNLDPGNKLIITTHSPYILNYLTLAVEVHKLNKKIVKDELRERLNNILPLKSTVNSNDLVIYQFKEGEGTIHKLKDYKGLPSDENYLNEGLAESNDLFSQLLEIEDQCR